MHCVWCDATECGACGGRTQPKHPYHLWALKAYARSDHSACFLSGIEIDNEEDLVCGRCDATDVSLRKYFQIPPSTDITIHARISSWRNVVLSFTRPPDFKQLLGNGMQSLSPHAQYMKQKTKLIGNEPRVLRK